MSDKIISTENLSFTYYDDEHIGKNPSPAIENVTINFDEGEYVAILGHNGSGKSTFAKLLNLILIPSQGELYIDGKKIEYGSLHDDDVFDVRRKIGMVFQNPDNQLVATVVKEDVAFGPENLGLPREEIGRRVVNALNVVGMQEYANHAPHKLSGGQKQRVAIAGIIAMKPRVIIFDESTAMLDPLGRKEVIEIMRKLNRDEKITVINITHYMDEAAKADRVIIINDGSVVVDDKPQNVFSKVELLHSIGLEAPQGTELLYELRKVGFDCDTRAITDVECADQIEKCINSLRK